MARRLYAADLPVPAGQGYASLLSMAVPVGLALRIRFTGRIRKRAADDYQNLLQFGFADGTGGAAQGRISFEGADGKMIDFAAKGVGSDAPGIVAVAVGTDRTVDADITVLGDGSTLGLQFGFDAATLLAGAAISIERLS